MSFIKSRKHAVVPHAIAALAASLSTPLLAQAQTPPADTAPAQAATQSSALPTVKVTEIGRAHV